MSQASLLPPASAGKARERTVVDYARHHDDWYVEPPWVVDQLVQATSFHGMKIHDPFCGSRGDWTFKPRAEPLIIAGSSGEWGAAIPVLVGCSKKTKKVIEKCRGKIHGTGRS